MIIIFQIDICSIHDINEGKNLAKLARTVEVLVNLNQKMSVSSTVHEYRPQTIGSVMSATTMSNLQIQPHQQQTAV